MKKRLICSLLTVILVLSTILTGCGKDAADEDVSDDNMVAYEEDEDYNEYDDEDGDYYEDDEEDGHEVPEYVESELTEEVFSGEGSVQMFIGEPFYGGTIKDEDDALNVLYAVIDRVGGDDSTTLELVDILENEEGNSYYTFRQMAEDVRVYGASVKLVVDKNGKALAINSTLIPNLKVSKDTYWAIDEKEAEAVVKEEVKKEGKNADIVPNVTEKTLLPIEDMADRFYNAWVVYTDNYNNDSCTPYLAHYVDSTGNYLYCNPVSAPGNTDALSGSVAAFGFENLEPDTWTGTVKKYHGETEEITVPVARDPETGDIYLADVERKIMCADQADFEYKDTLTPRIGADGEFDDNELIIYNSFIEVYDFFKTIGWNGPDGEGTPTLILMDWVDENGEPVHNACYAGIQKGFCVFQFNREEPDGEAYDTMAHEFAHAYTGKNMINNIYLNEYGAINESMSDIFGNLTESLLGKTKDKTWLIMENGIKPLRSMSDPHKFKQPAFVWDKYYVPSVSEASDNNDNGGVHTNSSLLNLIAYRLNESGMDQIEQFYFWMNVAMISTPRTGLEQMAEILPWVLSLVGHDEYMDVLKAAIDETGIASASDPDTDTIPEGLAKITMTLPDHDVLETYDIIANLTNYNTEESLISWVEDATDTITVITDPGKYIYEITIINKETGEAVNLVRTDHGWETETEDEYPDTNSVINGMVSVKKGQEYEVGIEGLEYYLTPSEKNNGYI